MSPDPSAPAGASAAPLTPAVIDRLREIVGDGAVTLQEDLLADLDWPLRDVYWIAGDDRYVPSVAVHPTKTAQIQEILRVATEAGIPVWTHSQGRNNAYGGTSARVTGSISISLRRMNRVLEIDEELAFAVVEPGVRWIDLDEELRRRGSRLQVSCPDIGWGSVIGNSLDNGISYLPYGADFAAPCGMEVVLADGELLRTGMGAQPDNPTWHLYKRGVGPALDLLFTQSNYGIVVKMGVWLMPRPEVFLPLVLSIPRDDQLAQAIDVVRELRLRNTLRGVPSFYNTLMAIGMTGLREKLELPRTVYLQPHEIQTLRDAHELGAWNVRTALYGGPEEVVAQTAVLKRAWGEIEGSWITDAGDYGPDDYDSIDEISAKITGGVPNLDLLRTMGPEFAHVDLSPIVPLRGTEVADVVLSSATKIEAHTGYNYGSSILVTGERTCAIIIAAFFDPRVAESAQRAFEIGRELIDWLGERGYSEYRVHLDLMEDAAAHLSWNDYAYKHFCERIKDAVDPAGILSPGRYGIWPERYRE